MNGPIETSSIHLDRKEFDQANIGNSSPSELLYKSSINTSFGNPQYKQTEFKPTVNFPDFFWRKTPALKHQIGGPEAFYLGQLWLKINTSIIFRRGLSLNTVLGLDLYNNFDEFVNPCP